MDDQKDFDDVCILQTRAALKHLPQEMTGKLLNYFSSGWEWFCNLSAEYSVLCFWLCVVFSPPVRLEKYGNHLKNTEKNIFLNILAVILYSNVKLTVLI